MSHVHKFLAFFNLIDSNNKFSVTNSSLYLSFILANVYQSNGAYALAAVAFFNYAHKRFEEARVAKGHSQSIDAVKAEVKQLKEELTEVKAVSEEAKDKASKLSMASGFKQLNIKG